MKRSHERATLGTRKAKICLLALIVVAVVFGGGGRSAPLANLVVQLAALFVLALSAPEVRHFFVTAPRMLAVLVCVTLALPLLQSLPLPPSVWSALPGRDLVSESLALVGQSGRWMSFSVNINLSLLAFVGLLPPFAALILAWDLPRGDRLFIIRCLFGLALLVLFVGAIQLGSDGRALDLYTGGSARRLAGTFANHNTAGLFLVLMLCILLSHNWMEEGSRLQNPYALGCLVIVLVIGVVLTQSRSSITLMLLPAALIMTRVWQRREKIFRNRSVLWRVAGSLILVLGLAIALLLSGRVDQALGRFEDLEDLRPAIWSDGMVSAERFWPVGSGMGTFDEVFQVDEALETVTPRQAGRAHNDYLEIAIEAGLFGLALVLVWIGYLLWQLVGRVRRGSAMLVLGSGISLVAIAAQSFFDYPLRNETLFCIAALLVAFLHSGDRVERKGIVVA